jgi:hypothetical protein
VIAQTEQGFYTILSRINIARITNTAVVYVYFGNASNAISKDSAIASMQQRIGIRHPFDITCSLINLSEYELLCKKFDLDAHPNQNLLLFYFGGNIAQTPYDAEKNLLDEFKKIGWIPMLERINAFLDRYPNNQEALPLSFNAELIKLTTDPTYLSVFSRTLQRINHSGNALWMHVHMAGFGLNTSGIFNADRNADFVQNMVAIRQSISDSKSYQREFRTCLEMIENEIQRDPYNPDSYNWWSALASFLPTFAPKDVLDKINFIPLNKKIYVDFSRLAFPLFAANSTVAEGFQFLADLEDWMKEQDNCIGNSNNFFESLKNLASYKVSKLLQYNKTQELENYLNTLRIKLGAEWIDFAAELKAEITKNIAGGKYLEPPNIKKLSEALDLPPLPTEKYFNEILLVHNFPKSFV